MKAVIPVAALLALIWIWIPTGPSDVTPGPQGEIKIYDTDTGRDTAVKFVRSYARLAADGVGRVAERQANGEFNRTETRSVTLPDGSVRTESVQVTNTMEMAKAFAAETEAARIAASKGVDARAVLLKNATPEQITEFLRSYAAGLKEAGK